MKQGKAASGPRRCYKAPPLVACLGPAKVGALCVCVFYRTPSQMQQRTYKRHSQKGLPNTYESTVSAAYPAFSICKAT